MYTMLLFSLLLFFQEGMTSTDEGVPYTPQDGFGGPLLWVAGIVVLVIVAFVVIRVFKGIQRSRNLERMAEDAESGKNTKS